MWRDQRLQAGFTHTDRTFARICSDGPSNSSCFSTRIKPKKMNRVQILNWRHQQTPPTPETQQRTETRPLFFFFCTFFKLLTHPAPIAPPPFIPPPPPPLHPSLRSPAIFLPLRLSLLRHRAEAFAGDFHAPSVESVMAPSALHSRGAVTCPTGEPGVEVGGGLKRLRQKGGGG